jgi:hypothetical protein
MSQHVSLFVRVRIFYVVVTWVQVVYISITFHPLNTFLLSRHISWYSTVLRAGWPRSGRSIPGRGKTVFLSHSVQTGSGIHPASCQYALEVLSLGLERQWREAEHSPASIAEVKNGGDLFHSAIRLHGMVLN